MFIRSYNPSVCKYVGTYNVQYHAQFYEPTKKTLVCFYFFLLQNRRVERSDENTVQKKPTFQTEPFIMSSKWHEKQEKKRLEQLKREEEAAPDETVVKSQISAASMGKGEDELFEKKLSKEEKKALAKAKREAKKNSNSSQNLQDESLASLQDPVNLDSALMEASSTLVMSKDLSINNAAAERLAAEGTICTFAVSRKGVDARSRDINISNFTMQHKGTVMLDATEIILNHGNRYGLIGRNGCGKSTFLKALGTRSVPIPEMIDLYFLKEEVEARKDLTALEAVMSVDEEREKLEKQVENLNAALAALSDKVASGDDEPTSEENAVMSVEEKQESIMDLLNSIYERLDALDAATAETRARSILKGLGFTHDMQVCYLLESLPLDT